MFRWGQIAGMSAKMKRLFPRHKLKDLKCDYEGLYSLTPQKESYAMAEIMADVCWQVLNKKASRTRIVDGTAGLGGNVMGFSRFFGRVQALELDASASAAAAQHESWTCVGARGSVLKVRLRAGAPLLFLDPPWGGYAYRRAKRLDLCIGSVPLSALLRGWSVQQGRARPTVVGLKLPTNFALQNFKRALLAAPIEIYSTHRFSKMMLVVVVLA